MMMYLGISETHKTNDKALELMDMSRYVKREADDMKGRTMSYSSKDLRYPNQRGASTGRSDRRRNKGYDPNEYDGYRADDYYRARGVDEFDMPARGAAPAGPPVAQRRRKSRFGALFVFVIFAGVAVCVSAFALVIGSLTQGAARPGPPPTPTPQSSASAGAQGVFAQAREIRYNCLIISTDPDTRTFLLYSIMDGRWFYASVATGTEMRDRYGNNLAFGEFRPGDVVEVTHPEDDSILSSIRQSPAAQTFFNQTGVVVDTVSGRINLGNASFIYGQELVAMSRGEVIDISTITPADTVTLRTYRHVAVFIEVTAGHGVVDVIFNEYIRNGTIAIGGEVFIRLDESRQFNVSEGTHNVVIQGDNIETYQRSVTLRNNDAVVVDLSDVRFRNGVINFSSNVEDVHLTVNGNAWNLDNPLTAQYGMYEIRATAVGYRTFERRFELRDPMVNFTITMEPLPTPTPRPERIDTTRLTIVTNIGGVEVFIDDQFVGRTLDGVGVTRHYLTFNAATGYRQLRLSRTGHYDQEFMFFVNPDLIEDERRFHLHPHSGPLAVPEVPALP